MNNRKKKARHERLPLMPGRVHIRKLPPLIREGLRKAFKATGCMDLYGGDARQMLDVIAQELTEQEEWIANMKARIEGLHRDAHTSTGKPE